MRKFYLEIIALALCPLLFFVLTACGAGDKKVAYNLHEITLDKIDKVELSGLKVENTVLPKEQITALVKLLNNSKNDIEAYNGPTPKGGPPTLNVCLKSNEVITLFPYGDKILIFFKKGRYLITQPDYTQFINQVSESNLKYKGADK